MKWWTLLATMTALALPGGAVPAQAPAPTPPPAAQPPAPGATPPPAPPRGPPPPVPLGDGPWDIATDLQKVHVVLVTKGLDHPWALAFVPGGDMLVTERPGRLRVIRSGKLDPTPIAGVPDVLATGIGGLLDIALHPNFAKNRLIYLSYVKPGAEIRDNSTLAVLRARWDGGSKLTDVKDIFVADAWYGATPLPKRCCGQGPVQRQPRRPPGIRPQGLPLRPTSPAATAITARGCRIRPTISARSCA